jgi:5-methylcytosine-specific restriction endonuclease McrA
MSKVCTNCLNYGWDIDHIIPISSAGSEENIIKLNHYTNLQPLCSKINRDIKKDKLQNEDSRI